MEPSFARRNAVAEAPGSALLTASLTSHDTATPTVSDR